MSAPRPESLSDGHAALAARFVVRAAIAAPSVHNTQPWYFAVRQGVIRLYADPRRKLPCTDPAGREMVISCGAALFNARLAIRHLGFAADVRPFPQVSRPGLLAEIRWARHAPPGPDEELLYRSIMRRHTHQGPFAAKPPPLVAADLIPAARQEQANLHIIYDTAQHRPLAGIIGAAELTQRTSPGVAAETARWGRPQGTARRDGAPAAARCGQAGGLEFATRSFTDDTRQKLPARSSPGTPNTLGVVALLTTQDDQRASWLNAGQALQRLLLQAAAHKVWAAFHTQPLELPRTREQIRTGFTDGAYPQMLLRLGCGGRTVPTPRRPVTAVLHAA